MFPRSRFKLSASPSFALFWLGVLLVPLTSLPAATRSEKLPVVGQWERIELSFRSRIRYTNALQQAVMRVDFVSPSGVTNRVNGFWDGGQTWKVRYSPDAVGRWTYSTTCSDLANGGLHRQSGAFLCTAATGKTRFGQHGPLRVAADHRHLEHADGTPFFWVGDAAWHAMRLASAPQWSFYTRVRASQKFNAVQWSLAPGPDAQGEGAFTGRETISLNLDFFKRLDPKVDQLNRAGLLNAIAPLWEIGAATEDLLPEDQAVALLGYAVARWGGNDMAWILAFEGADPGPSAERWKRIGRAVFGEISHAPVIVLPGEVSWVLDEFRGEQWVDAFGCQTARVLDEDSLQWLLTGPLTMERRKEPARPLITLSPPAENAPTRDAPGSVLDAGLTRRLLWWSALLNTPAGVSYRAHAVAHWDPTVDPEDKNFPAHWPAWQKQLFLPGARDLEALGDFFGSLQFWRLIPFPRAVASQPGLESPRRYIVAGGTEARDVTVIYVPEDRSVEVATGAMPPSPSIVWVNTRNGQRSAAVAVVNADTTRVATPDEGDWVLLMRRGR